jgi:small multidrug resistance family-3 protein
VRYLVFYALAAFCEIAGCFAFWVVFRLHRPALWLAPGLVALVAFAWFLTRIDSAFAGRTYAAYGGVYIAASLGWLILVERGSPDRWDLLGAVLCVIGALVILLGPR